MVRCRVVDAHEALVSVDGREDIPLAVGDVVEVRAIERPVRLVEPEGSLPFWDLFRAEGRAAAVMSVREGRGRPMPGGSSSWRSATSP